MVDHCGWRDHLGKEFLILIDEGALLAMPIDNSGVSV